MVLLAQSWGALSEQYYPDNLRNHFISLDNQEYACILPLLEPLFFKFQIDSFKIAACNTKAVRDDIQIYTHI